MQIINSLITSLEWLNERYTRFSFSLAWILVSFMVAAILLQVFMRYVLNNALPWPEEAARALMIWMMGLVAAPALRRGDFVAITLLPDSLPRLLSKLLQLALGIISVVILIMLADMSINFFERGFRTRAASFNMPRAWVYLAMCVCYFSMLFAALELALKHCRSLLVGAEKA